MVPMLLPIYKRGWQIIERNPIGTQPAPDTAAKSKMWKEQTAFLLSAFFIVLYSFVAIKQRSTTGSLEILTK